MAKNYHGQGDNWPIAANKITAAVTSGDLVKVQAMYGVAKNDGAANAANVLQIKGVFTLKKATGGGTGGSAGAIANATAGNDITAGAGTKVGFFWEDAADGDATAEVALIGQPA